MAVSYRLTTEYAQYVGLSSYEILHHLLQENAEKITFYRFAFCFGVSDS